jgi:hypothetical protein
MHEPDREKIKSELAELFAGNLPARSSRRATTRWSRKRRTTSSEIQAGDRQSLHHAPDVSMDVAGRSKVYTSDAGHMTLIITAARFRDRPAARAALTTIAAAAADMWQWTNSVTNTAEARRIIATWATALRKAFGCVARRRREPGTATPGQTSAQGQRSSQERVS